MESKFVKVVKKIEGSYVTYSWLTKFKYQSASFVLRYRITKYFDLITERFILLTLGIKYPISGIPEARDWKELEGVIVGG